MSDESLQSYLDAIPLPVVLIGLDNRIQGANKAAKRIAPGLIEKQSFVMHFRQPALARAIESCLKNHQPANTNLVISDGTQDVLFDVTCAFVSSGSHAGVLVSFTDISDALQAGQIRRDFIANVSHELRTPLTAIVGFIETLQGPARDDSAVRDRFLSMMSDEAMRMNRLVGDLLSLSRVEEDARLRPTEMVDMDGLIRTTLRNLSKVATENHVTLAYEMPQERQMIAADSDQMMQVLINLVENAIKYGGKGTSITVSLSRLTRDRSLRGPAMQISVSDNGQGIENVHIPRLTERFYRIDSHRSREMGGTGLGLAIVKHIINRHRGRLKIESTLSKGSTFTIFLPDT